MGYQIADVADQVFGEMFETEVEAKAALDRLVDDEVEGEANWLTELAQLVSEGGAANTEDEGYVRRILAVPDDTKRVVALACARERLYALNRIVKT